MPALGALRLGDRSTRTLGVMIITRATLADVEAATECLVRAFVANRVTGYLSLSALDRRLDLLSQFFSLLLRARLRLAMPVLLAREDSHIQGVVMGHSTVGPEWPTDLTDAWEQMEQSVPGMAERESVYGAISKRGKSSIPHYYLGVIGVDPRLQGKGVGVELLRAFCASSAADPTSNEVYLETATPTNVPFYTQEGFTVAHTGTIGENTSWCMYLRHARPARG